MQKKVPALLVLALLAATPTMAAFATMCAVAAPLQCCCGNADAACGCLRGHSRPAESQPAVPAGTASAHDHGILSTPVGVGHVDQSSAFSPHADRAAAPVSAVASLYLAICAFRC